MWKEFREFAVKGNALQLAIGVILATTFQPIVNSLVNDIIMPPIGVLVGQVDFKDQYVRLDRVPTTASLKGDASLDEARKAGVPVVAYGQFINTIVNFFIVSFCVFMIVKTMNRMQREKEAAPTPPPPQEKLLIEIRDSLKAIEARGTSA